MGLDEILGLLPFLLVNGVEENNAGQYWLLFELGFWTFVAILTLILMWLRPTAFGRSEAVVRRISQHQTFWLIGFALSVVLIRVALLPEIPVPVPVVHDEFSYLVGADTLAHGRLTNPSTPMWEHLESFHINMRPTYQSMYPPAQAAALALGEKLTGVPWAGVLLSTAVMCSAVYWALLGCLPPAWAWLGGTFCVVRFGIMSYWTNSYMGGSVAAIGGALLLGAVLRLRREASLGSGLAFAAGLLILANSRPLEGFIFSIPFVFAVAWSYARNGGALWKTAGRKLAPGILLLVIGLAWIPYYNWRGTGHPLLMPYMLNFKEYHITRPYLFQKPNPIPEYRHQAMRTIYVYHEYVDVVRPKYEGMSYIWRRSAVRYYAFYLFPFLLLLAPAIPAIWGEVDLRVVLASIGLLAVNVFAQRWRPEAHYVAPATAAIVLLLLYSLRHFRNSGRSYGTYGSQAIVIGFAVLMVSAVVNRIRDPYFISAPGIGKEAAVFAGRTGIPLQIQRERVKAQLDRLPGKHLVIVHHPYHDTPTTDWIYNDADLDHAHALWARDMGYLKNRELIQYYSDRQVWYVDRGDQVARLVPYEQAIAPWKLALSKFEDDSSQEFREANAATPSTNTGFNQTIMTPLRVSITTAPQNGLNRSKEKR